MLAAREGDISRIIELLEQKTSPNAIDRAGGEKSALLLAVNFVDVSKYTRDKDEQKKIRETYTLVGLVGPDPSVGSLAAVRLLLEAGADPNVPDLTGSTPLMAASLNGNLAICQSLLDRNARVTAADQKGNTALTNACLMHRMDVVKLLLDRKADINAPGANGITPLGYALLSESRPAGAMGIFLGMYAKYLPAEEDLMELLLKRGANLEAPLADGDNLLHLAAALGNEKRAISSGKGTKDQ